LATGYTDYVRSGKVTTLRAFAMVCARAFGACIAMRDDPMDVEIPSEFKPDTSYHDEAIARATSKLRELPLLSEEECARRSRVEFAADAAERAKWAQERADTRKKYEAMLSQVKAWKVPKGVAGLRKFMIDQLEESIRFDCHADTITASEPKSGEAWRRGAIRMAKSDLGYHTRERRAEIKRVADRNKWLASLRSSIPAK